MPFRVWNSTISVMALACALAVGLANPLNSAQAETLTVGGTGSAAPVVEHLAQAYRSLKPDVTVRVIHPPMGSNAAIRAVLAGAIDLAAPGRPLADTEKAQGGQEWELGRTPFIVATSRKQPHPGFTFEELAAIYSGKVTVWADGSPIRLVLRSPMESDTLIMRRLSPAMDAAVAAALARPGVVIAANDLENVDLLEKTPGSLGTTNLSLMQSRHRKLQVLPINGAAPTPAAMAQGTYPYVKSLYIVRGPTLSAAAQGFLEFVLSASGREAIERIGYMPTARQP
ncbi:MAG: substrate-binding domain-containing protein [Candidatus Competibacter sp.]|nr:substrate-binding domain-containing protein [Candidatus Competibacter sp.]HRD49276.1 substrate-binding domain-containing protein [Candidatus Contendobacter sp.]